MKKKKKDKYSDFGIFVYIPINQTIKLRMECLLWCIYLSLECDYEYDYL